VSWLDQKPKVVRVFKIDLDKIRNEINLLEEKLDKENAKTEFERKERNAQTP
jgi:hypothetical protein